MRLFCCSLLAVGLLGILMLENVDAAQFKPPFKKKMIPPQGKPGENPAAKPADGPAAGGASAADPLTAPLIAADIMPKLKLNAEQKPKVDELSKEFAAKLKEAVAMALKDKSDGGGAAPKGKGDAPKAKGDFKGKGKGGKGGDAAPELKAALDLRMQYEDKLGEILNDAQKEVLLAIKAKAGEALLGGGGAKTEPKKK
ncbi:MAG: hypothetical protein K2R98_30465 [Gemmataceae bacterium]|nr:hypothetical protein [Gemmataceae bacterium]